MSAREKAYFYKDLLITHEQLVHYQVIKKQRKPYFEFAYQSFESKINFNNKKIIRKLQSL